MKDMLVAAVCMEAVPFEVKRNLDLTYEIALKAASEGAVIACFPELSLTGYMLDGLEGIYGSEGGEELLGYLGDIANETGLILMAGLVEVRKGRRPMIAHSVAVPGGPVMLHRKTHLSPQEKRVYEAGDEIRVFSEKGSTFGIQLCYEGHFPEISAIMALMGAEVIFFPHASPRGLPDEKITSWLRHLRARAYDNSIYVVACNQAGTLRAGVQFPGVALVLKPDGKILASYAGQGPHILFAELKAGLFSETRGHEMKFFLPSRRPELYAGILKSGPMRPV